MKLIVSYHHIGPNWYVGVFYETFFRALKTIPHLEVEYISMEDFAKKYGYDIKGYAGAYPSIFNIYNLFVHNPQNNKTFIHSWNDYAPVMMNDNSGIKNFDVVAFSCVSSLTKENYNQFSHQYNIIPSFYILEDWNEHFLIETFRRQPKVNDKLFFNGACYGLRQFFRDTLQNTKYFEFKEKHYNYKDKQNYYREISQYKHGFNLDGAAKICYRDIEYFGMGITLFRDELNIMTHEPIVPNVHYFVIVDDEIKSLITNVNTSKIALEKIEHNIENVFKNYDIDYVVKNAREWYERNALPHNQLNTLMSFMKDFKIFE